MKQVGVQGLISVGDMVVKVVTERCKAVQTVIECQGVKLPDGFSASNRIECVQCWVADDLNTVVHFFSVTGVLCEAMLKGVLGEDRFTGGVYVVTDVVRADDEGVWCVVQERVTL